MGKILIIDVEKCTGCMSCMVACKDEFVANDWTPYSKPQPEHGVFWIKVEGLERGTIPKVKVTYTPILCMHCDNAPCIKSCPTNAITKRNDGIVLINPAQCDGCKHLQFKPLCIEACPYNAVYYNSELGIAQKCTLCAHLLDDPDWKYGPRCSDACPIGALTYGDENDPKIKQLISKAETLNSSCNTKPRVYYLNLAKPFISGCIVDSERREVVTNAKVTALDLYTSEKHETLTDEFGDFWLKNLKTNHKYLIKVGKEGYIEKTVGVYTLDKDINVGTVFLKSK